MVSVAPLHRASHFDPTDVTVYTVPLVATQVRATASPAPSLFEILVSDQISPQGSKTAANPIDAGQQTGDVGDELFASRGRTATLGSSRELTIADIQTNRLGFNFVPSTASTEMNSLNLASNDVGGSNPLEQSQNPLANPSADASAKALASQELTALASSAQRLLPRSMFTLDEPAREAVATSTSSSEAPATTQQSSPTVQNVPNTSAPISNSVQNATSLPGVPGTETPRSESLSDIAAAKIGMPGTTHSIGVDQSRSSTPAAPEGSVSDVRTQIRVETLETGTGQGQNSSERLATAIVDSLGQVANSGPSSVSIRLTLPELGIVVLYLSVTNGLVSIRIGVKNSRAKRTLESQLNELRNSLIDRDVNCDECQVDDESDEGRSTDFEMAAAPSEPDKPVGSSRWNHAATDSAHQATGSSPGHLNFVA